MPLFKSQNDLLCSQLDRNSNKDSSSLEVHIEPVCKLFSTKIVEYDARRVTGNKCNTNFLFKPSVTSHNEVIHDIKTFTCELKLRTQWTPQ